MTDLTFSTDNEAIAIANGTVYGLAASVWTGDLSRALRVSDALNAGTVSVKTVNALSAMTPFGGILPRQPLSKKRTSNDD